MLLRLGRLVHRTHRSLRDLCYTLVLLAGASAVLTYHISRRLPTRATDHDDDVIRDVSSQSRGRSAAEEWRSVPGASGPNDLNGLTTQDEARIVLEGAELERKFRQRLLESDELAPIGDGEEEEEEEADEDVEEQRESETMEDEDEEPTEPAAAAAAVVVSTHELFVCLIIRAMSI
jgi:hypothetical protein